MTSNRAYLIRALHEWIIDNAMTPHIIVDAQFPETVLPGNFVEDGKIVLNISPTATDRLVLGDQQVTFNARFGGQSMGIRVPVDAVLGIFARENGNGMMFPPLEATQSREPVPAPRKPELKIIK